MREKKKPAPGIARVGEGGEGIYQDFVMASGLMASPESIRKTEQTRATTMPLGTSPKPLLFQPRSVARLRLSEPTLC